MIICHISDVHIRSNSRHKEYAIIFEELYDKLRIVSPDMIFLGGDIAHTKTQEAPEFYDFTAKFLKSLSDIAPVHIILGNHDMSASNLKRLDVITPIVNMLDSDKIYLHKMSKRVDIENFSFFNYSIADKSNWNTWDVDKTRVNVGWYHGMVNRVRLDSGFYLDGEIELSEFTDMDYVMLGDIHMRQSISERDCILIIDEDELNKYPGAEIIEYIDE